MRETIMTPSNHPASVRRLRDEQIAHRSTWSRVPDDQTAIAAMHVIHVKPANASTLTLINPLDPGTVADVNTPDDPAGPQGWLRRPGAYGTLDRL